MIFGKHKKIAAAILALLIIFQPLCAIRASAYGGTAASLCSAASLCVVTDWDGSDWLELLAHFSAFAGLSYWIYSGVSQAYDAVRGLDDVWDFLSLLLRLGLIPHWYYEFAPEPPGAFSI